MILTLPSFFFFSLTIVMEFLTRALSPINLLMEHLNAVTVLTNILRQHVRAPVSTSETAAAATVSSASQSFLSRLLENIMKLQRAQNDVCNRTETGMSNTNTRYNLRTRSSSSSSATLVEAKEASSQTGAQRNNKKLLPNHRKPTLSTP